MVTVTMLQDHQCCPDGFTLTLLEKNEAYKLPTPFAERLVDRGLAKTGGTVSAAPKATTEDKTPAGDSGDAPVPADDPIAGLNAKQAIAAIAELTVEQLDAISGEEDRKSVLEAIEARRAELTDTTAGDAGVDPAA